MNINRIGGLEECIKAKHTTMQNNAEQDTSWQNTASQNNAFLQASGKVPISALWHSAKPNTKGQVITVSDSTGYSRAKQDITTQHKAFIGAAKAIATQNNAEHSKKTYGSANQVTSPQISAMHLIIVQPLYSGSLYRCVNA